MCSIDSDTSIIWTVTPIFSLFHSSMFPTSGLAGVGWAGAGVGVPPDPEPLAGERAPPAGRRSPLFFSSSLDRRALPAAGCGLLRLSRFSRVRLLAAP